MNELLAQGYQKEEYTSQTEAQVIVDWHNCQFDTQSDMPVVF